MAVIQRAHRLQTDAAPLWLPRHDGEVVEQATARTADFVEGYTLQSRVKVAVCGSPWKMATTACTALAVLLFFAVLPTFFGVGIGALIKLAFYQSWTLGLMLIATSRVRTVSVGVVTRYWLAGMFSVAMVAFFVNGPLAGSIDQSAVWVTPIIEEILKACPLGVAILMGRKAWRHPGLSDLMVLGFAVGAGYGFHEDGLWERAAVSGFELNAGLFVPSIYQPDGIFVVGHAVWTGIIGLAIGLFVFHRRHPAGLIAGTVVLMVVIADHMAINDAEGSLAWVRQLLFNGKAVAVIFLGGFVAAVILDQRRLAETERRDHLFPGDRSLRSGVADTEAEVDPLATLAVGRYRRLRNGVHTTVEAVSQQWPPRSEAHPAPLGELARLGRAADIGVGPGTSSTGWAPDPESPGGFRYVGPIGFTVYAAGNVVVEPEPDPLCEIDDPDLDDEARHALELEAAAAEKTAARTRAIGPTSTSVSTPKARIEAVGSTMKERAADFWQYFGVGLVAVALFVLVRVLTAGPASTMLIEATLSLPDATNSPALVRGLIGAAAAAVAIRGRNSAVLGSGWNVGPGDTPTPDRPDECEA